MVTTNTNEFRITIYINTNKYTPQTKTNTGKYNNNNNYRRRANNIVSKHPHNKSYTYQPCILQATNTELLGVYVCLGQTYYLERTGLG